MYIEIWFIISAIQDNLNFRDSLYLNSWLSLRNRNFLNEDIYSLTIDYHRN